MIAAPLSLTYNIERFCSAVRQNTLVTLNKGLACYRELIRQNLSEILKCTFPLFSRELPAHKTNDLIESFLNAHPAEEPEFHHIATEWLKFMQVQPEIPARLLALMEYEWVLFSVEISPFQVTTPLDFPVGEHNIFEKIVIRVNPTLTAITLPFTLGSDNGYAEKDGEFSYAIFRKHNHNIFYKKLSTLEQCYIQKIKESHSITPRELHEAFSAYHTNETLSDWLLHNATSGLVVFQYKGQSHD
ncbi:putative DNA-binding domain-containing protein [Serratia nematodiphila]|uniref:HvfC/BufC family peptide modification chaperone n=1 Tax=Serratia nematodiphila TaxID=458197 RepID=UPI0011D4F47F|nr:putative DNA-binding domain-containing protein [Serratia nematodiphila]TXE66640.1 hypothetical protein FOT58_02430 [Serratia nematodiphila]